MDKIERAKDLEKASKEYVKDIPTFKDSCLMKAAFEDGWLSCKEQMMKEAMEAEVTETCGIKSVWIKTKQFKPGQKVKIIVCKKED